MSPSEHCNYLLKKKEKKKKKKEKKEKTKAKPHRKPNACVRRAVSQAAALVGMSCACRRCRRCHLCLSPPTT
jgi:hypothetical protein